MLPRPPTHVLKPVWLAGAGRRIAADSAGVFEAVVARDAHVTSGQVLGHLTDYLGRPMGDIRSPIDGLVTFIRGVPSVWPKATLVNVAPILPSPGNWTPPGR
jgi:predicted deacylase